MYPPNRNPGWIWAHFSEAVFDFRRRHGAFPALLRTHPETFLLMARAAKTFRVTVAGVPVQPDSEIPEEGHFLLDRTKRAQNPM